MNIQITRGISGGKINAIPAKADAHRVFIAAALSGKKVQINLGTAELSQDISATLRCLEQLGVKISRSATGVWEVTPAEMPDNPILDCGESGSTLRFLLPVAAALGVRATFTGCGRLPERPIADLVNTMSKNGVKFSAPMLPLTLSGKLEGDNYKLPGNVSSQYISGLLFAIYAARKKASVTLTTKLESSRYIEMTVDVLQRFGVKAERTATGWDIDASNSNDVPANIAVEGDWSNAATFLVAGAIAGKVTVSGLNPQSLQPDRGIIDILRQFGAEVSIDGDNISAAPGIMRHATVDVSETPDLLPVLSLLAAVVPGRSRFINAARLRLKESDRLASTAQLLRTVGIEVKELPDALEISGSPRLSGGTFDSFNDHRLVMAACVAATSGAIPLALTGAEAINKSQPDFFNDFTTLGGQYNII